MRGAKAGVSTPRRILPFITMYTWDFLLIVMFCSPSSESLCSRSRLRGTQRTRLNTRAQVRTPAEVRGTCSRRSKSRNLASNHGIHFRPVRASQVPCKTRPTTVQTPIIGMNHDNFAFSPPHEESTQHTARTRQQGLHPPDIEQGTHEASCSSSSYHAAGLHAALSVLPGMYSSCIIRSSKNKIMRMLVPIFGVYADPRI